MLPRRARPFGVCWVLVGCLAVAGCRARPIERKELSPAGQHLEKIGDAYLRATTHLDRPPKNLEELVDVMKIYSKPEEILRSPGDGENFEIVWGVELRRMTATGRDIPIVAYEKVGKDGRRHVLRGRTEVLLLTPGELKSAKFPPGYKFPF
jgi:hypothetical protein